MRNMPPFSQYATTPLFNAKAVAHATEVPADTFRAWERRYGVPRPKRTAGGRRLYSEQDIAIIRWLRDRTAEGMNISRAVTLLNSSQAAAQPPGSSPSADPPPIARLAGEFTTALLSFDAAQAGRLLSAAFARYPLEEVLLRLIQPAMVEIGERWRHGETSVAAEHFATHFVRCTVSALLAMRNDDAAGGKILVACAPDEQHDLGALFAALLLSRRGWRVIYLGARVPLPDLLEAVQTLTPDLVCLAASLPETAAQLADIARAVQAAFPGVIVGFGGRIFNASPELRSAVPGTFLGHDVRDLVDTVASLLAHRSTSTIEL